jgi:spore coat protein A
VNVAFDPPPLAVLRRDPADSDGYPNRQRAATLWYHDHTMDLTGPQVYRGLAGFHLIHDDEEDALPLPKGERDIPLMIVDRAFEEDGAFRHPGMNSGALGDVILVNGAPWPVLEVDAARYRLRILNASNARRYQLRLDPATTLTQIGSDGGLLDRPVTHGDLLIAPGERFDVVVDFFGHAPRHGGDRPQWTMQRLDRPGDALPGRPPGLRRQRDPAGTGHDRAP